LRDKNGNKLEKAAQTGSTVYSGTLFEDTVANKNLAACDSNADEVCYKNLRQQLQVFYEYETGSQSAQRVSLVDKSGEAVQFDQPIPVKYVHSGTKSNSGENFDGATIFLEYEGK